MEEPLPTAFTVSVSAEFPMSSAALITVLALPSDLQPLFVSRVLVPVVFVVCTGCVDVSVTAYFVVAADVRVVWIQLAPIRQKCVGFNNVKRALKTKLISESVQVWRAPLW